jgi:hypothetical protein
MCVETAVKFNLIKDKNKIKIVEIIVDIPAKATYKRLYCELAHKENTA